MIFLDKDWVWILSRVINILIMLRLLRILLGSQNVLTTRWFPMTVDGLIFSNIGILSLMIAPSSTFSACHGVAYWCSQKFEAMCRNPHCSLLLLCNHWHDFLSRSDFFKNSFLDFDLKASSISPKYKIRQTKVTRAAVTASFGVQKS